MMQALRRDVQNQIERNIRQAASASGLRTTKTSKGLELKGTTEQIERFNRRVGK